MKPKYILMLIIAAFFMACSNDEHLPDVGKFYYPIPQTDIIASVNLGAYYFTYTSADWAKGYPDTPLLGEYDVLKKPDLLEQQFEWAVAGNIDFFILKWDATANDSHFLELYRDNYLKTAPKMVINYSLNHLKATSASPIEGAKLEQMVREFEELYDSHLSKDHYYRISNRPVIMITSLIPSSSQPNAVDFEMVMRTLREALTLKGIAAYFIGEFPTGWSAPQTYKKQIVTMDAVILNNWAPTDYDKSYAFYSFNDLSWKNWCDSTARWNIDFVPCIFPAYNDKVSNPSSKNFVVERTVANFVDYCNVAKRNLTYNRFVIVNSWNDFLKGNTMEPCQSYQKESLDIMKEQFTVK